MNITIKGIADSREIVIEEDDVTLKSLNNTIMKLNEAIGLFEEKKEKEVKSESTRI